MNVDKIYDDKLIGAIKKYNEFFHIKLKNDLPGIIFLFFKKRFI